MNEIVFDNNQPFPAYFISKNLLGILNLTRVDTINMHCKYEKKTW